MKNPWTTTRVPVSIFKDAETLKEIEQSLKDIEKDIKNLKQENAYLKSVTEGTEEKLFPPASGQRTIAEEKRDKDLGAVRSELARKIREEITQKTLEGHMNVFIYVREFGFLDVDILKKYSDDDIMEPIIKSLREEGYQVEGDFISVGGFFKEGYRVSWN